MPVEDLSRFKSEKTPVLIEETYEIESAAQGHQEDTNLYDLWESMFGKEEEENHLFILVHGF